MLFFVSCILSHQWHYLQPEGPKDVYQAACVLASDQHGFTQRLPECPLPWTDIPSQEDHKLQTGCLPSSAW